MRAWLQQEIPEWTAFKICKFARYLGFMLGPEAASNSWTEPYAKFRERTGALAHGGAPASLTVRSWNMHAVSVLPYVGQMMHPLPFERNELSHLMNRALRCPPQTFTPALFARLQEVGMPSMLLPHLWSIVVAIRCALVTTPESTNMHADLVRAGLAVMPGRVTVTLAPWPPQWLGEAYASWHAFVTGQRPLPTGKLTDAVSAASAAVRAVIALPVDARPPEGLQTIAYRALCQSIYPANTLGHLT